MTWIHCPGCDAIADASDPCCSGCGRCLACGTKRINVELTCQTCSLPFCNCCGRCPACGAKRSTDGLGDCPNCGHPSKDEQVAQLIRSRSVRSR